LPPPYSPTRTAPANRASSRCSATPAPPFRPAAPPPPRAPPPQSVVTTIFYHDFCIGVILTRATITIHSHASPLPPAPCATPCHACHSPCALCHSPCASCTRPIVQPMPPRRLEEGTPPNPPRGAQQIQWTSLLGRWGGRCSRPSPFSYCWCPPASIAAASRPGPRLSGVRETVCNQNCTAGTVTETP
jgi:hypothetical protein